MTQSISAAIHIQGSTVRIVELEREETTLRLRRLDSATFEFEVAMHLRDGAGNDSLDQVRAAIREMLGGTEAASMGLVVHPLDVYNFFMPVPTGLSDQARERRVAYQAALVTDTRSSEALHTTSRSVRIAERNGEEIEWLHVLAVPQAVEDRFESLVSTVPGPDPLRIVSTEAAAEVMQRRAEADEETEGYSFAIGAYPGHTEYTLTHEGTWHHAHAAQEARAPENRTYYAAGVLNRIGVPMAEVENLFVYGPEADASTDGPLETVFDRRAVSLDPFDGLGLASEQSHENAPSTYVPCIGGALRAQSP